MKTVISAAALVMAGLLSTSAAAQTAPPNGWDAHISGCFASDPTFSDNLRGFERLPTPSSAQRVTTTLASQQIRMAVWRQDCANNPAFPVLMVRFEFITNGAAVFQNRDFELIQGSTTTFAEAPGWCAAAACRAVSLPVYDERGQIQLSTYAVAQTRDPNVLLRNGFQFRLRGTTQGVTIGGTGGGTGDLALGGRLNGTFFDPARSGEGIMVDFFDIGATDKGVFVSWYTYDDAGNGLWLVGNATLAPNATSVDIPMIVTTGGRFGPLFQAGNIRRTGWGSINLRFPNCSTTVMRYTRTSDGQTGQYTMGRLGPASGIGC
jgi:hypothetical protein